MYEEREELRQKYEELCKTVEKLRQENFVIKRLYKIY